MTKAKQFLNQTKNDETLGQKCDLIDASTDDVNDGQQVIEMNLLLFENSRASDGESSDDSDSSQDSESSEDTKQDSDEEPQDSDEEPDKAKDIANDKL